MVRPEALVGRTNCMTRREKLPDWRPTSRAPRHAPAHHGKLTLGRPRRRERSWADPTFREKVKAEAPARYHRRKGGS